MNIISHNQALRHLAPQGVANVVSAPAIAPAPHSGRALGMGLDRLVMTIKDVPDMRYPASR